MITCVSVSNHVTRRKKAIAKSGCLFVTSCMLYDLERYPFSVELERIKRIALLWDMLNNELTANENGEKILFNNIVASKIKLFYGVEPKSLVIGYSYGDDRTHFVGLLPNNVIYDSGSKELNFCNSSNYFDIIKTIKKNFNIYTIRSNPYCL